MPDLRETKTSSAEVLCGPGQWMRVHARMLEELLLDVSD